MKSVLLVARCRGSASRKRATRTSMGGGLFGCTQRNMIALLVLLLHNAFQLSRRTTAAAAGLPTGPAGLALPTPSSSSQPRAEIQAVQDSQGSVVDRPPAPEVSPVAESVLAQGCTFFLVRHGQSHPNVAGKIVSGMEAGCDPANGLTELGLEQARAAGKELKEVLLRAGCSPANTMVLTSPFSRAKETAEAIRECLDCELREERDLRERFFGDFDGREDSPSYSKVWALDALSAHHGELGVEPAARVAERVAAVIRRARKEVSVRQRFYSGDDGQPFPPGPSAVVLVSHGDALQTLQCALAGRPVEQHRSLPHLDNCGIRVLRPPAPLGEAKAAVAERTADGEKAEVEKGEDGEDGEESGGGCGGRGGGSGGAAVEGGLGGDAGAFRATGARVFRAPVAEERNGRDGGGKGGVIGGGGTNPHSRIL